MTLEQANYREQPIPDWAEHERWADLAWITDNLPAFHSAAGIAYESLGRGAVVVETTCHTTQDGGHPAAYLTQGEIARYEDADIGVLGVKGGKPAPRGEESTRTMRIIVHYHQSPMGDFGTTSQKRSIQNLRSKLTPEGQKSSNLPGIETIM